MTQPQGAPVSAMRASKPRRRQLEHLGTNTAAIVIATLFALVCGAFIVRDADRAPDLTIDNPTSYDVRVEVSDGARSEWTALGTARQFCNLAIDAPVDQGDTWSFRFHAQGVASHDIVIDRHALEQSGWRVTIGADLAQQWEQQSVPHPPQQNC